jgi:hypothetical protein
MMPFALDLIEEPFLREYGSNVKSLLDIRASGGSYSGAC